MNEMQGFMGRGVSRGQLRGQFIGINELASRLRYCAAVPNDRSLHHVAEDNAPGRALPADLYRHIPLAAWVATMLGGMLGWTAFFHLV